MIALQYNPDTLTRTLQVQATGRGGRPLGGAAAEGAARRDDQARRRDRRHRPARTRTRIRRGRSSASIRSSPRSRRSSTRRARSCRRTTAGARRHAGDRADETPLTLFVWSKNALVPVRITDFSITEEAFDPQLNPIRAKVSLGMRVLTVNDLGFEHRAASLFMTYQQQKESSPRSEQARRSRRSASRGFREDVE